MDRHELERGSSSTEAAIIAPALFLVLGLLLAVGSYAIGQQSVTSAAHSAARAGSLATSQQDATHRIEAAFTAELREQGRSCTTVSVDVDAAAFTTAPGTTAAIHSTITCTVPYAQLIPVPGLTGTRTITVTSTSPLDTYRERS
ncbi:TadE/TadG family type IV pilus assembly protein [Brachybacterium sp. AOP25-B2-12]|uniref:TadE/TadG family type IV pilus assembly protein n=1 Tax=Brachybacterium sp. AOP25-B2-12 TaxID=3457710 RepID=UPI004033DD57